MREMVWIALRDLHDISLQDLLRVNSWLLCFYICREYLFGKDVKYFIRAFTRSSILMNIRFIYTIVFRLFIFNFFSNNPADLLNNYSKTRYLPLNRNSFKIKYKRVPYKTFLSPTASITPVDNYYQLLLHSHRVRLHHE